MAMRKKKTGASAGEPRGPRVGAVAAVVLAGGAGRRMFPDHESGGEKSLLALGGRPLIAHVVRRVRPQVYDLVIATRGAARRLAIDDPALAGVPIVHASAEAAP